MSKIGKKPILLPSGVTLTIENSVVSVKGPKGELSYKLLQGVTTTIDGSTVVVAVDSSEKNNLWGLTRTLVQNMVVGVSEGYMKKLHVLGVGFTAKIVGQKIVFALGFSHPVEYLLPTGIVATAEKDTKGSDIITLTGIDKQLVGETAAQIRKLKEPEPYKGKGIRYIDEIIKLKAGKAAKK